MSYKLFDAVSGGTQVGTTVNLPAVQVVNGIFTVSLDYGSGSFDGTTRFLEITVVNTVLNPRQEITNAPYAVTAQNALKADIANDSNRLGGITADQYVQTSDTRLADDRNPLAGSPNYIQNQSAVSQPANLNINGNATIGGNISGNGANLTNLNAGNVATGTLLTTRGGTGVNASGVSGNFLRSNGTTWASSPFLASDIPTNLGSYIQNSTLQQATSNFNVDGTGTANIFNAATQLNIGGSRVLGVSGIANTFVGLNTGSVNTGSNNTFVGKSAGNFNTTGSRNSFFGTNAGTGNTIGNFNAFFGMLAGANNTSGSQNSFFGDSAGFFNTTGTFNVFFGVNAGRFNTIGTNNSFVGTSAGQANTTGNFNSFFGKSAGQNNTTGFNNTFLGNITGQNNTTGSNNSFVGANAGDFNTTGESNSFFGEFAGFSNSTGSNNAFFGRAAGNTNNGSSNSFFGDSSGYNNSSGNNNSFFGNGAGFSNSSGGGNSFVGNNSGGNNSTGVSNSFVGWLAGFANTTGDNNSFFGTHAGENTSGDNNTFFGSGAGLTNTNGSNNLALGYGADFGSNNLTNATAIGAGAVVSQSNALVLGTVTTTTQIPGTVKLFMLGAAGSTSLCRNAALQISTCTPGNFADPQNNESIETLRTQNLKMSEQLKAQAVQIEALKQVVCAMNPTAEFCGK